MDPIAPVLILYSRIDAFGDGLLRIPALRAARTAFPDRHIVYACKHTSTLETLLRRHVDHLVDEFRTNTPLLDIVAEAASGGRKAAIVDFRMVVPWLIATRLKLIGRGVSYQANFPGFALSSLTGQKFGPRPEHNAWRYHRLVERMAERRLPFDHRLAVPEPSRLLARQIIGTGGRPLILICGNGAEEKRMKLSQIATVARDLIDGGFQLLYLETPGGGATAQALEAIEPRLGVIGPGLGLDPSTLAGLYLALGEAAAAYVGIEGGMAHLLATVMTPMVVINHGASIERWRPLSNVVEVVEAREHGSIAETPAHVIVAAVHRLLGARRRDHAPSAGIVAFDEPHEAVPVARLGLSG
jgi:ADP-heptose:LPS heptosyltransferase